MVGTAVLAIFGSATGSALAESEQAEFDKVRDQFVWTAWSDSRPISPFVGIPFEFTQAVPLAKSYLDSVPGRAESFAGFYHADENLEEVAQESGYENPTLARCNFPDIGRGSHGEVAPAGTGGPRAAVQTPSRTEAYAQARNGVGNDSFVAGALADTKTTFDRKGLLTGEAMGRTRAVRMGDDASVDVIESWVRVEHAVGQEPMVSYRLMLAGVQVAGEELVGMGAEGITLAGSQVAGPDLVEQFNAQAEEHGDVLEEIAAKLSLRFVEPRVHEDDGAYTVSGPAAEIRSDNTLRKDQTGDNAGLRLAYTRIFSYLIGADSAGSESGEPAAGADHAGQEPAPRDEEVQATPSALGKPATGSVSEAQAGVSRDRAEHAILSETVPVRDHRPGRSVNPTRWVVAPLRAHPTWI